MGILIIAIIAILVVAGIGAAVYVFVFRAKHKKEVMEESKLNDMGAGYLGGAPSQMPQGNVMATDNNPTLAMGAQPAMNDIVGAVSEPPVPPAPEPPEMPDTSSQMSQPAEDSFSPQAEPTVGEIGSNFNLQDQMSSGGGLTDAVGQPFDGQASEEPQTSAIPPVQEEDMAAVQPEAPIVPDQSQQDVPAMEPQPEASAEPNEETSIPVQTPVQSEIRQEEAPAPDAPQPDAAAMPVEPAMTIPEMPQNEVPAPAPNPMDTQPVAEAQAAESVINPAPADQSGDDVKEMPI